MSQIDYFPIECDKKSHEDYKKYVLDNQIMCGRFVLKMGNMKAEQ